MFWKMEDLTKDIMSKSIKDISQSTASPFTPFIYILDSLGNRLKDWISAATSNALLFETKAFAYETIEAQFPSLVTGSVPETIICTATFAPMMDMHYLYAWRILLDKVLSSTVPQDIFFFARSSPGPVPVFTLIRIWG